MSSDRIDKLSLIEQAEKRLQQAVDRLEKALNAAHTEKAVDHVTKETTVLEEINALRKNNLRLREVNRTAMQGLDSAIDRLRSILESS